MDYATDRRRDAGLAQLIPVVSGTNVGSPASVVDDPRRTEMGATFLETCT